MAAKKSPSGLPTNLRILAPSSALCRTETSVQPRFIDLVALLSSQAHPRRSIIQEGACYQTSDLLTERL